MTKYPCKGCKKRTATCHADCKEYHDAKAEDAEKSAARKKQLEFDTYRTRVIKRSKKIQNERKMGK